MNKPQRGIFVARIAGIRFYLDYSWFIIAAMLTYVLATGFFPQKLPGTQPIFQLTLGLTASVLFFGSILLHELGHSIVSQRCGIPVPRITLLFIGGIAQISREPDDARSELKIALAGPAVSAALVLVYEALSLVFTRVHFDEAALICGWLGEVNLV